MYKVQAIWNFHFDWWFDSKGEADAFLDFWKIDKNEVNYGYLFIPKPKQL